MLPPYRPAMISGTSAKKPTIPTANVDPVSSNTSRLIAITVNWLPSIDSVDPIHSRRKAGMSRTGAMSSRNRATGRS